MHLANKTETKTQLLTIPDGSQGTLATLKIMKRLTKAGKKSPKIRALALELVQNSLQKDYADEARKIHRYVRDEIRYVQDIRGVETVHSAEKVLEIGQGDCDDKSVLAASLLESINHPTLFHAIGFKPGTFSHVFVETKIGSKWVPLETTEPWPLGKAAKGLTNMRIFN